VFIVKDILEAQTQWMSRCRFLMLGHMVHGVNHRAAEG